MAKEIFDNAKRNKADEFYTRLSDIELELRHYRDQFTGKVVLCNCDDPFESNFFRFFALNFNYLGLKKLVATCFIQSRVSGTQLSIFSTNDSNRTDNIAKRPHKIEIVEVNDENKDSAIDLFDIEILLKNNSNTLSLLNGDGDFRSAECVELLKDADIVVTNPPFSLFCEFVTLLETYGKNYLIIGNTNALTYREIFPLIKADRLRTGYTNFNTGMYFYVPDNWDKYHKIENGRKMVRVSTSCWFTNLEVKKHKEFITLYKKYSPIEYPKYDNYDAIEVSKVAHIPDDYLFEMGVPITFIDKYNPSQFEIIDALNRYALLDVQGTNEAVRLKKSHTCNVNGKSTYFRIVIRRKMR